MPANVIMLGAAYQHGCLPVSGSAITRALELNGAAVEVNLAAFAWGRATAADPEAVTAAVGSLRSAGAAPRSTLDVAPPAAVRRQLERVPLPAHLREVLERRAADLGGYQDAGYAAGYVKDVLAVLAVERERGAPGITTVTEAYAAAIHKLMAYKDEYEVARLHLDAFEQARLDDEFGPDARVAILLHPPVLRAMGVKRKLRLGSSARPLLTSLRAGRRLRGTALDPFGRTAIRRLERALIDEHRALVRSALRWLTPDTQEDVAKLAALPDLIRGYEEIKLANVERYRVAAAQALAALAPAPAEVSLTR
jgi:indolepyruvate ferredoxin oxidoreductase